MIFEAAEFSPYALVVNDIGTYDETAGLPYYVNAVGDDVFIGFAANGKYIAPDGVTVLVKRNAKSFSDIDSHWAESYIDFVNRARAVCRYGCNIVLADTGMTRRNVRDGHRAAVRAQLREIEMRTAHSFTDCNYDDYTGNTSMGGGKGRHRRLRKRWNSAPSIRSAASRWRRYCTGLPIAGVLPAVTDAVIDYPFHDISMGGECALYWANGFITGRNGGSASPARHGDKSEVAVILRAIHRKRFRFKFDLRAASPAANHPEYSGGLPPLLSFRSAYGLDAFNCNAPVQKAIPSLASLQFRMHHFLRVRTNLSQYLGYRNRLVRESACMAFKRSAL